MSGSITILYDLVVFGLVSGSRVSVSVWIHCVSVRLVFVHVSDVCVTVM